MSRRLAPARMWPALALLLTAILTLPLAATAEVPPHQPAAEPAAQGAPAAAKATEAAAADATGPAVDEDRRQRQDYLKAVPPTGFPVDLEGDVIKMHALREWTLLTYPTGTLPSAPWSRARAWVRNNVQDAPPWAGPPVKLDQGSAGQITQKATIVPDTNVWTAVGPQPLDSVGTTNNAYTYGVVAGRAGASGLASDPANPDVAYAGFASGGLWKTTNLSAASPTWTALWDDKDFVTQAASTVELDPTNSNVLYVGTGDWPALDQFSAGIMKSTDAGATWTHLGADVFTPYSPVLPAGGNRWSNQNIKAIEVDPNDPSTVLVGTRYDLYISHDAGLTWEICGFGNNYTDPSAGGGAIGSLNRISSIYLDARGASTVAYVVVGYQFSNYNGNNGVYRFTVPAAGCPAWPADFETLFSGFPTGTGNGVNYDAGGSNTGRIELAGAIGPDSALTLYAQVSAAATYDVEGTYVLRPDGGSTTWSKLAGSTASSYVECDGSSSSTGQDWYDLFLAVDPTDDKTLYIGHIDAFRATVDAGYSSLSLTNLTNVYSTSCPEYGTVHPDQHAFAFVEGSGGQAFLLGNDGGVYYNGNQGALAAWKQVNDTISTNQFYGGQIGADFANGGLNGKQWLFGGMQDNGNASWDSSGAGNTWIARSVGGDGFYTSFDPLQGDESTGYWITEYTYGSMYCSDSGADGPFGVGNGPFLSTCSPQYTGSPDWSAPFQIDTLHCTDSECSNYIVGEDYVWVASSYKRGVPSWSRISGSLVKTSSGSIITVSMAPSEPKAAAVGTSDGKVWWSESIFSGSGCTQAAANSAAFSCSNNTGAAWVDADAANAVLPDRAVLQVAFDPQDHNLVYAAVGGFNENTPTTPGHLFALQQAGGSFTVVDKTGNLPDVPASSVAVNPRNRKQVFVGTYFGFYYTDDIDASPVTWVRYQTGLPNTVIKHLTIDRGPASNPIQGTTLAAFTYGRGAFVLALPAPTGNQPPTASFTYSCTDLTCDFTDTSTDPDGTIVSWDWDFGDTNTSTAQNPTHTYAAAGTYTVSLTVTDDGGLTDSTSTPVTVTAPGGGITLSATGYKVKGVQNADLTWSGAGSTNVDVYRDGALIVTTPNDGAYTDNIGQKGSGTYVYQVCEEGTSTCSNTATVVF